MNPREIFTPLGDDVIKTLKAGDAVLLTGKIYTARDAAHALIAKMLEAGEPPPFDFAGQTVFYAGPAPARPGAIIGSIGPTTAGRMDLYSPALIAAGLKSMIGKGSRSAAVRQAIIDHKGVYFAGVGGVAALMAQCVTASEPVAFEHLGAEAVRMLTVERLPLFVAIDCKGRELYKNG